MDWMGEERKISRVTPRCLIGERRYHSLISEQEREWVLREKQGQVVMPGFVYIRFYVPIQHKT